MQNNAFYGPKKLNSKVSMNAFNRYVKLAYQLHNFKTFYLLFT